jgi:hypothetical protein
MIRLRLWTPYMADLTVQKPDFIVAKDGSDFAPCFWHIRIRTAAKVMLRQLLCHSPHRPRGDLAILRSRDAVVRTRVQLINLVRGQVKALGGRIPQCSARSFTKKARQHIPELLRVALLPVLELITQLTDQIKAHDNWRRQPSGI